MHRESTAKSGSMKEALRVANERLDLMSRLINRPVWEWQVKDDEVSFNNTFCEIFGYRPDETREGLKFWSDHIHPDESEETTQAFRDFLETQGDCLVLEYRFRRKDGTYAHVRDQFYVLRDGNGKATYAIGTMVDCTEQRKADQESQQIRTAIEFASDGICVIDPHGRSVFHNRTFTQLTGYSPEELNEHGGLYAQFTDSATAEDAVQSVRENGFWAGNAFVRTKRSQVVELFMRANAVRNDDQVAHAVIVVATDVSEDRKAQRKIAEQAALLNQAQDAILVQNLDGQITYWNKGAERLFGWTAAEVIGLRVQEFLYRDEDEFVDGIAAVLKDGTWNAEVTDVTKDGKQVLVQSRWTLLRDDQGKSKSVLSINTDITEKKKLEAQFLRAQRLESIGTLAGGIAHDLNNVLGPIIMAVDLFKIKMTEERDRELIESVEISARRGADMVRQVLSFARGFEGRRTTVQPSRLLREIANIARDTFPKTITVSVTVPESTWNVPGDSTQLHQVVLNLTVNARDAMPDGGTLILSAENVEIDAHFAAMHPESRPGSYVALCVSDSGMGMTPDTLEKVFEPFFTTKEIGKGTGLGLSTSLSIVKSHKGFVTVESEVGKGSTFRVFLPADVEDSEPQAEDVEGETPRGNGELVLVIDDEASVRAITRQTLEAFGYRVVLAGDGAEGIAMFARHIDEVQVVLTDMMMPVMDGGATIRAILRLRPDAKIIAASGLATKGAEAEAASSGGVRKFLPKPYTAGTILRALRDVL
jgi:two-component system, cell cycle sensor histidine kinase and response regulator CckA